MKPDPIDDLADPYGAPRLEHDSMVSQLAWLTDELLRSWSVAAAVTPMLGASDAFARFVYDQFTRTEADSNVNRPFIVDRGLHERRRVLA